MQKGKTSRKPHLKWFNSACTLQELSLSLCLLTDSSDLAELRHPKKRVARPWATSCAVFPPLLFHSGQWNLVETSQIFNWQEKKLLKYSTESSPLMDLNHCSLEWFFWDCLKIVSRFLNPTPTAFVQLYDSSSGLWRCACLNLVFNLQLKALGEILKLFSCNWWVLSYFYFWRRAPHLDHLIKKWSDHKSAKKEQQVYSSSYLLAPNKNLCSLRPQPCVCCPPSE